jgi:hypothetical protein
MNDQPVTTTEIADLLHHIRTLTENPGAEPAARAEVLARKADLLARIGERRAQEWTCEHADQARQIAHHGGLAGMPPPAMSPAAWARPSSRARWMSSHPVNATPWPIRCAWHHRVDRLGPAVLRLEPFATPNTLPYVQHVASAFGYWRSRRHRCGYVVTSCSRRASILTGSARLAA